jgi:phospholipid/cholesterol/gamma-HCH transport system substrate-binding protein
MSAAVKARLVAFAILSAVGITYITASYLGFVDQLLGRGFTVHATLPTSGGLYEGSEVTYRGVKIGEVARMDATEEGVRLDLALEEGTELPVDSPMFVHNLSAVGEQYLDFEPPDDKGPYAEDGQTLEGSAESLPVDEADLLIELDSFVNSVDQQSLQTLVSELGDMFEDTGRPLQTLLDSGGEFVDEASAHSEETIALLESGLTVLKTQQDQGENIQSFSRDLRLLTYSLRGSDADLRKVLNGTPGTAREVQQLMEGLEPSLPILLGNAIGTSQVVVSHLDGLEHLLVLYPRVIAGGFTGSPPDGYGHVNMQFDFSVPPCTEGYKPRDQWRRGDELKDAPIYPAECKSGPPYVMRGPKHSPGTPGNPSPPRSYAGNYDPASGLTLGAVDADGNPVRFSESGDLSILGDDSWKWLLVGPVAGR